MNHTTPRASDDIAVLRTRQLEATKRRIIAELKKRAIAFTSVQYSADVNGAGDVVIKTVTAEDATRNPLILEQGIKGAFYDLSTLVERFALDLVGHYHAGFEQDGGYGYVVITSATASARIEHTSLEPNEVSSETTF